MSTCSDTRNYFISSKAVTIANLYKRETVKGDVYAYKGKDNPRTCLTCDCPTCDKGYCSKMKNYGSQAKYIKVKNRVTV